MDKDKEGAFTKAIQTKLNDEDFDFRGVFFPDNTTFFAEQGFTKKVDFSKAIFAGRANFSLTIFEEKVDFNRTRFSGDVFFYQTNFLKNVYFQEATFSQEADFSEAIFKGPTLFYKAIFLGEAEFSNVTFQGNCDFFRSTFSGNTYFTLATFEGHSNFSNVRVESQLEFDRINWISKGKGEIVFNGDFEDISFVKNGLIRFRDLSLSRSAFKGTDLRQCWFFNVEWHQFRGRQVIYGEVLLHKKEGDWRWYHLKRIVQRIFSKRTGSEKEPEKPETLEYAGVEESYRYLKLSYEKAGDFKQAGDFHYGEMEMHRKASPWRRWVSLYSAYWALSGYGERPFRAFIWLLLLIPAWAGLVWGLGIDQAGSQNPISYWDTLLFIFEKATFQRPEWPKGITWLGKFLGSLSVLLLPGQAALFILALRNRLGRRR